MAIIICKLYFQRYYFRGISKNSFDGRGNYTLGIKEQLVFPEVEYDQVIKVRGLDIVIVTTANTNEEALALLTEFGLPFRKQERKYLWQRKVNQYLKQEVANSLQETTLDVLDVVVHTQL